MNTSSQIIVSAAPFDVDGAHKANAEACAPCSLHDRAFPRNFSEHESEMLERLVIGRRRVARHDSLYRKHDRMGMLYTVRFGQFKLIGDAVGDDRVAGFHMASELVGLDGVATGQHQFRAMALEDSEVCEIPTSALFRLMAVDPAIQRRLFETMGEMLNQEYAKAHRLAMMSLEQRFAHFLIELGDKYARLGYSGNAFRLSMSRGDIGGYIGTSVESVSRLITRFNAGPAVTIAGRAVELLDRPALEHLILNGRAAMVAPAAARDGPIVFKMNS